MNKETVSKYINRLTKEWKEHSKIIIAVDYDSTLSPWSTIDNQEDIDRTIKLLKVAKETGAYIVLNSCCKEDRYKEMEDYCLSKGIAVDAINKTPIEVPYGNNNKPYANIYLDDRAGLQEALDILECAMYNHRSYTAQGQYRQLNDVA